MMILSVVILLISTFIQGVASNYLGYTYNTLSIFSTIYVLIALLILNPYFENKRKYFTLLIIFGLIIDIAYTNTFILNTCIFIACYYVSKVFHFFLPYNIITINISNLLSIYTYHIISFIFLNLFKYDAYPFSSLLKILNHSILMTIIYSSIIYLIIVLIKNKLELKEVK